MPRIPLLLAVSLAALLPACRMAVPTDVAHDILQPDTCGAAGLRGLVGQPAEALDAMRFSQPVRIVRPGQPVTLDFNAQRLTVETDGDGLIGRLSCG